MLTRAQVPPALAQALDVYAELGYACGSGQYETDLRLFTATPDLGRLQAGLGDVDELARQVSFVPLTWCNLS